MILCAKVAFDKKKGNKLEYIFFNIYNELPESKSVRDILNMIKDNAAWWTTPRLKYSGL